MIVEAEGLGESYDQGIFVSECFGATMMTQYIVVVVKGEAKVLVVLFYEILPFITFELWNRW